MPLPAVVRERRQALLDADEEIQYIFPASSTVSPTATSFVMAHIIIVVTAKAVVVLSARMTNRYRPPAVWGRYPRATRIGPVDTSSIPTFRLGGIVFEVDDEYVPVINAADAEVVITDSLPPDPLPDLCQPPFSSLPGT